MESNTLQQPSVSNAIDSSEASAYLSTAKTKNYIFIVIFANAIIWACIATLLRHANSDAIEAYQWSQSFAFGYSKNPYFVGWFFHFIPFTPKSLFFYHLTQYLSLSISACGMYWLAKIVLDDRKLALLSVILIFSITGYFDLNVYWNNDNFLLQLIWPYLFVSFYHALKNPKYWLLVALLAGIATMTKYNSVIFIPFMFLALLTRAYRHHFTSAYLYIGIVLFLLIVTPNIYWLFHNNFIAIKWAMRDATQPDPIIKKLSNVAGNFFPLVLCYVLFNLLRATKATVRKASEYTINQHLFVFTFILPTMLLILYMLFFRPVLYAEWLIPSGYFSVLMFFIICKLTYKNIKWRNYLIMAIGLFLLKLTASTIIGIIQLKS